jgi:hypothetical protein
MKIEWAELLVMSEFDDCVLCPVEDCPKLEVRC